MATLIAKDVRKIERVPAYVDANPMAEELLTKSFKLFGYTAHNLSQRGPLGKTLQALDIKPLDDFQVRQYMRSRERDYVAGWAPLIGSIVILTPLILGGAWIAYAGNRFHWNGSSAGMAASVGVTAVVAFLTILIWAANVGRIAPRMRHQWKWSAFPLRSDGYQRFIPLYVLNLACQIKEQESQASFIVHELTHFVKEEPRPVPDPFLQVRLGSESYFIEVWDERDYREE